MMNMDSETLAKLAYNAYGNYTKWKTWNGGYMPPWDGLESGERDARKSMADNAYLPEKKVYYLHFMLKDTEIWRVIVNGEYDDYQI